MTPADAIFGLLTQGSGALFTDPTLRHSWPLFTSSLPDGPTDPDNCAVVLDTEGILLPRLISSGKEKNRHGVQLLLRCVDYETGMGLVKAAALQLSRYMHQSVTVGSATEIVDTVSQATPPLPVGRDERRRNMISVNFLVMLL